MEVKGNCAATFVEEEQTVGFEANNICMYSCVTFGKPETKRCML